MLLQQRLIPTPAMQSFSILPLDVASIENPTANYLIWDSSISSNLGRQFQYQTPNPKFIRPQHHSDIFFNLTFLVWHYLSQQCRKYPWGWPNCAVIILHIGSLVIIFNYKKYFNLFPEKKIWFPNTISKLKILLGGVFWDSILDIKSPKTTN